MTKKQYQFKYATAKLIGANRAYVSVLYLNWNETMALCVMPYGPNRWIELSELTDFVFVG